VLRLWGPEELLGPRAAGFAGSVEILGRKVPSYDLLLIVVGPLVLGLLWLLLTRTRWGTLVRAATQDREMVGALGVNQAWLFTSVFALGACWPAWAARCSCRASRPISSSTCTPSAPPLWSWWSAAWARSPAPSSLHC
jgi:branched-subunit amino acid ABC-type transport system permease component